MVANEEEKKSKAAEAYTKHFTNGQYIVYAQKGKRFSGFSLPEKTHITNGRLE